MTPDERAAKVKRYEQYERRRAARVARNRRYYLAHREQILANQNERDKHRRRHA